MATVGLCLFAQGDSGLFYWADNERLCSEYRLCGRVMVRLLLVKGECSNEREQD